MKTSILWLSYILCAGCTNEPADSFEYGHDIWWKSSACVVDTYDGSSGDLVDSLRGYYRDGRLVRIESSLLTSEIGYEGGFPTRVESTYSDGYQSVTTNTFANGRLVRSIASERDEDDTVTNYTYFDNSYRISLTAFWGTQQQEVTQEFNNDGLLQEELHTFSDNTVFRYQFSYIDGRVARMQLFANGELGPIEEYAYDCL